MFQKDLVINRHKHENIKQANISTEIVLENIDLNYENAYEISVVLPCLNEERTIQECIIKSHEILGRMKISYEIIVSDNNSTDNSV